VLLLNLGQITAQNQESKGSQITHILDLVEQNQLSRELGIKQVQMVLQQSPDSHTDLSIKCGNPILHTLKISGDELLKSSSLNNPEVASVYLSPSGKFSFTYYTTGSDSVWTKDLDNDGVPDYVETAAFEMDKIWESQVVALGFLDPLVLINPYPIQFRKIDYYGHTEFNGKKIVINSTFVGLTDNTDPVDKTIGALKVTLAHEFKHAVQFRYNRFSGDSHRWAEMDATLMEEVNYDEVNDYYNYITSSGSLFTNPELTVIPGSYEDITFALYFYEKFGPLFWTNVWSRINNGTTNFLDAVSDELIFRGSTMKMAFSEMALWHFYAGSRTIEGFGFKDAPFYPNMKKHSSLMGSLTQFQLPQTLNSFAFQAVEIQKGSATGYVNLGLYNENASSSVVYAGYKDNPTWKTINSEEENFIELLKDNLTWDESNTVWLLIPNASRTASTKYRTINVNSTNPGLFKWADLDENGFLNNLDIRKMMHSILNVEKQTSLDFLKTDITLNGELSGLDVSEALAVVNQKQDFLTVDVNLDGMLPELDQFRLPVAKNESFPDSLILKLEPLEGADQQDTRIQLSLDFATNSFIRSLYASIPIDTSNFSIVNLVADSYLSSAELDWVFENGEVRFLLVNDELIHSGPIIQINLNRKKAINSADFSISAVVADEISDLKFNQPSITAELPTKLGVFTDRT
ncbi:MAG: hypothetical protein GW834_15645, partial [Cyanobacteria bacterium]|nr:hypothetical protein [Cyanobacteria bacterium CG_2015-09_32_10]